MFSFLNEKSRVFDLTLEMCPSARDTESDLDELAAKLETSLLIKKGGAKRTEHSVGLHKVYSWKFNEWEYYKKIVPSPARGLFTKDKKIIVRGYDKFFNMGEVPDTKLEYLEANTVGPYELTVKENGCIIFISGLEDGTIIVCSKHSTGQRDDATRNHAVEGENQLKRQLESLGHSVEELAQLLYKNNITLVAELCDDSFEEHILSYKEKDSGLYIHGINLNTIAFQTYPMEEIKTFAKQWGFKCVDSFKLESFEELMEFLNKCKVTGTYDNREIEGFVVRCKVNSNDFFFKFKFEQPYLLYRHFREVTKHYLAGKPYNEIMKKFTTEKYVIAKYMEFIMLYFADHEEKKQQYLEGHGIIEVRKAFLTSLGLNEISGMNLLEINEQLSKTVEFEKVKNKYILVPIATIGCGKTTVAQTLHEIYGWEHIQNDNIASKNKNKLVVESLKALTMDSVVFCDRNNHMKRERKQLFDQFYQYKVDYLSPNDTLVFVAVNFILRPFNKQEMFDVTFERVHKRGDNHQSIKSATDPELAKKIMDGFIQRLQPLDTRYEPDSEFDLVINVDYRADTAVSVKHIIESLQNKYPETIPHIPTEEELQQSIQKAYTYKPEFTKTFGSSNKTKVKKANSQPTTTPTTAIKKAKKNRIDFFGVKISHNAVLDLMDQYCSNNDLWKLLKSINRVQPEFHVTIGHMSSLKLHPEEWKQLTLLLEPSCSTRGFQMAGVSATITINTINITEELICLTADISDTPTLPILNKITHITIGTFKDDIKPYMSNVVLEALLELQLQALTDGVYTTSHNKVQVINLSPPVVLHYQPLFCHFI